MPRFVYFAKDREGNPVKGVIEAKERNIALDLLHRKGLIILSLQEDKIKPGQHARFGEGVSLMDLVLFTRQLATMVESGIPLPQAFEILYEQITKPYFKKVILSIKEDIEGGESLSNAMAKFPQVFSPLYIYMVRAGEASGALNEILDRLAGYLESTNALISKVRSAMVYPIAVLSIAVLITTGLLIFVVPKFKEMFETLGGELPLPTKILLAISDILRNYIIFVIVAVVVFVLILVRALQTEKGKYAFDSFILKVPVIGDLLKKVSIAKFARTLATLMRSGVPILDGLEIVAKVSGNKVVEMNLLKAKENIKEGESISSPLEKAKIFPPMVYRMVAVGEQTGELEKMLLKIADFYEEQVNAAVEALTSLMEPMIMVILGTLIGGIVISLFLPVFNLSKLIQ